MFFFNNTKAAESFSRLRPKVCRSVLLIHHLRVDIPAVHQNN